MNPAIGNLDTLGELAQVVAAIAVAFQPDAVAGGRGELVQHLRRHGLLPRVLKHGLRRLCIGLGLIADRLEAVDAVFERRVVQIDDAASIASPPTLPAASTSS